jgi:WD40 repeat protein
VWEPASDRRVVLDGHKCGVNTCEFSADGARVLTTATPESARVWDAATGRLLSSVPLPRPNDALVSPFSADGLSLIAIAPETNSVTKTRLSVMDARTGGVTTAVSGFGSPFGTARFLPGGDRFLTYNSEGLRVWDRATGRELARLSAPPGGTFDVAVSPNGRQVVALWWDGSARCWDGSTEGLGPEFREPSGWSQSPVISRDGRRIVTVGGAEAMRAWDCDMGRAIGPPLPSPVGSGLPQAPSDSGHKLQVALSPDGSRAAICSERETVRVWGLVPDARPSGDLVRLAELLSCWRLDSAGGVGTLSAVNLVDHWTVCRSAHPEDFRIGADARRHWREAEIASCLEEGNVAAAEFHYWWLVAEAALAGKKGD